MMIYNRMFGISYMKYTKGNNLLIHKHKMTVRLFSEMGNIVSNRNNNNNILIQDIDIDNNNVLEQEVREEFDNHFDFLEVTKPFKFIKNDNLMVKEKKIKVSNKVSKIKNPFKEIVDINKGGYNSYLKDRVLLGNIIDILNDDLNTEIEAKFKENVLEKLEVGKTYSVLLYVKYIDEGQAKGSSPMKSIIITKNINTYLVLQRIKMALSKFESEYLLSDYWGQCYICWREWLSKEDYLKGITDEEVDNIVNDVILEEKPYTDTIKKRGLDKLIDINKFNNIISLLPNYNSVELLPTIEEYKNDHLSSLYKDITNYIYSFNKNNTNVQILNVYLFNDDINKSLLFVFEEKSVEINRIICQTDYETWNSVIDKWNSSKYPYRRWIDNFISENKFSRLMDEYKIFIYNGKVDYIERMYKFPDLRLSYRDKKYDDKIGTLDLETLSVNNRCNEDGTVDIGLGKQEVYAGSWALNHLGCRKFIINNSNIYNGNDIIRVMFDELFKLNVKGYTIYAQNLGRFDSIFLIKEIAELDYVVSPIWKDNAILKIKVFDPKSKQTVTLLDSLNLFNTNLNNLLLSFDCKITKGQFPHLFVTRDNLNYIGNKPDIKYYSNISPKDYEAIPIQWSLKDECLKYLEKDVLGLLEVLNKMSKYYYEEFEVNITNYMTLPSLSMSVFGFNFYDEKYEIKMIKGPLEKFIREAYYGGNVGAFTQSTNGQVERAYHYDMNSQYPYAMLNKMPTGDPVFSTNTNLNYYFGYVYALIIPPSESELKNLYIQFRSDNGIVSCPRTPFYRWIASFELESAIKNKYKTEIICGINFPNALQNESENLFKDYVVHFYNKKKNAKNSVEKSIAKLMLNSLSG